METFFSSYTVDIACKFDYVAVYSGFNESDARIMGKFCGKTAPQPMSALGNMIVRFKTDATVGGVGFLANYRASGKDFFFFCVRYDLLWGHLRIPLFYRTWQFFSKEFFSPKKLDHGNLVTLVFI